MHDIGKNLVCMCYEGAGFRVVDLGVDVSAKKAVAAIREHNADIVSMSALISTTRASMPKIIEEIRSAGLAVKVMVGGVSVTKAYAEQIGADAYGRDAVDAVTETKRLMGKS